MDLHRDDYFRRVGYDAGFEKGYRFGFVVGTVATLAALAMGVLLMIYRWGLPW